MLISLWEVSQEGGGVSRRGVLGGHLGFLNGHMETRSSIILWMDLVDPTDSILKVSCHYL